MEVVAIANTRNPSEQASFSEERGLDVNSARDSAEVGFVELQRNEDGGCDQDSRHPISRILEMLPVSAV